MSKLEVCKDEMSDTFAEAGISSQKPVAGVDDNNKMVVILNCSTIIHVLFGDRSKL